MIVLIALTALFGCVWLREQLVIGGEPDWLVAAAGGEDSEEEQEEADQANQFVAVATNERVAAPSTSVGNPSSSDSLNEGPSTSSMRFWSVWLLMFISKMNLTEMCIAFNIGFTREVVWWK